MSSRSSTSSFRRSLALGIAWVALGTFALERSPIAPEAYFGGRRLAEQFEALHELAAERDLDVLAVGDSSVVSSFDAARFSELTGLTAFNFGIVASDLQVQSMHVRHVLIPRFAPRTILWGLGSQARRHNRMNEQYLGAPALANAAEPVGLASFELGRVLPQYQRRRLVDWLAALSLPRSKAYDRFGFRTTTHRMGAESGPAPELDGDATDAAPIALYALAHSVRGVARFRPEPMTSRRDEDEARAAFVEALRAAREHGIRVIAYTSPYFADKFAPGDEHARRTLRGDLEFDRWLCATLAEFDVPYLNLRYYEPVSERSADFADDMHLNRFGAESVTEMLARTLFEGSGEVPSEFRGSPSAVELAVIRAKSGGQ